jgi:hypothetical protein
MLLGVSMDNVGSYLLSRIIHCLNMRIFGLVSRAIKDATEPLYRDCLYDIRQRIARLEQRKPQPLQKDRGEILRALLAANGGKMLAKEARQEMHLSESRFSELLSKMKKYIEKRLRSLIDP